MNYNNESMTAALRAIADMKVTETTNAADLLALCQAIALTELSKSKANGN